MTTKTTTKTTPAKTTTKAPAVMDIAVLVEAFKAAEVQITGYTADMDFIAAKRGAARVQASRAAAAIFQHPAGKSQYATAAALVGVARNTFRKYVDAGLSLTAARRNATDITPADIKKVNAGWESEAAAKKTTRAARPEGIKGAGTTTPAEGESAEGAGLPTAAPAKPVTFADVQASVKALREVVAAYRATGAMSEKELRGLGVQLANVAKLASKGE